MIEIENQIERPVDNFLRIKENTKKVLKKLPAGVKLLAATKSRSVAEIEAAINAGAEIIGENYIDEAEEKYKVLGRKIKWHLIGHLQSNKVKEAVRIFDTIETLDSEKLARRLNKECSQIGKIMQVLIEVNSANEPQKNGLQPSEVEDFLKKILEFDNLKSIGLMTMGPLTPNPEETRPFFRQTKEIFSRIKNNYSDRLPSWNLLSMGMTNNYKIALEEGANMIRIGTGIFGPRTNNQIRK